MHSGLLRLIGALGVLLIAGCGGTVSDPDADDAEATNPQDSAISIDTARGQVELAAPATRVVALEWIYAEELLALGVEPVGVADTDGYDTWISADGAELPGDTTDVGTRQEPSIEQIRALEPDVIVSDEQRLGQNAEQLADIAPVVSFDPTERPQLETMRANFAALAEAVGKDTEADRVLGELDATIERVAGEITDSDADGESFALAQGLTAEGAAAIRMFTDDAYAAELLSAAGLTNAWEGQADEYGMTTVGVEDLTRIDDDASFLYVAIDEDNPFTGELADNAVWQDLEFVEDERVEPLDPGTWLFGGPLSAMQLLDETAAAYTG